MDLLLILHWLGLVGIILNASDISNLHKKIPFPRDMIIFIASSIFTYDIEHCALSIKSFILRSDNLSRAVCYIAEYNYNIKNILHLLDDFLTVDPPNAIAERTMAIMTMIFKKLNIPIAAHKTVGPVTCLEYLGIVLDTVKFAAERKSYVKVI
jgi:hypothetical protein